MKMLKKNSPTRAVIFRGARAVSVAAALLVVSSCDLDLTNPNAVTEEEVIADADGLLAVAVGMQAQFAFTIDDYLVTNALVTDEWGTRTLALPSYISLLTGQGIDASFLVIATPWANSYTTIKSANTV